MRGISALEAAILFGFLALVYIVAAYLVWLISYNYFRDEASVTASLMVKYVASQVADLMASSLTPGVSSISYKLFLPTQFPNFDAYSYSIALINNATSPGAVALYVLANFSAYRGSFSAYEYNVGAFAYALNATFAGVQIYVTNFDRAIGGSACLVPSPVVPGAYAVNLTKPGCGALWYAPTPANYKLLTVVRG
ncbi:hypothetical protein [Thermoproteus tenax]|uniref:Uncharacterized protein n=1 Tax=Thermoproteus tenax (strain ATCC 35583 / DSM 2078 / JCM 9277 / NBRC 100435 / Kra 1) TaxID=768679 RepID=G4RPQ0_THETK|nr:hypothetical protein [Thermoproteus tenax]CCC81545.1 conserved hypothetical protein [Thermoproteus tenax Kra 1]